MTRGEIRLVDFAPARPDEADEVRPAVLVSNDAANTIAARRGRGVIAAVPLTSNLTRVLPFHVVLPADECGLRRDSKAQAEQVRSMSISRVGRAIGGVPLYLMEQIDDALRLHLDL